MVFRQIPRVPVYCPPGFGGWYTVAPGDTLYCIAQRYRISVDALIKVNPHIPDPNILFVGDVLCVPFRVTLPCGFPLKPIRDITTGEIPAGVSGAVLVYRSAESRLIFNIAAILPPPNTFGEMYTRYHAYITLECTNFQASSSDLTVLPERPQYMFTSLDVSDIYLSPRARVTVGLSGEQSTPPPPGEKLIFEGFLGECGC